MKKYYLFYLLAFAVITSCSVESQTTVPDPTETSKENSSQILNSDPNFGVVTGTLLFTEDDQSVAKANVPLFLAEVLTDENGVPRVAAINRIESPRTATDSEGQFIFSNVPPGDYGIVLDIVVKAYLLPEPDSDDDLIISVLPGEVIDLGILSYDTSILPGSTQE
jgi:hypothetical protein